MSFDFREQFKTCVDPQITNALADLTQIETPDGAMHDWPALVERRYIETYQTQGFQMTAEGEVDDLPPLGRDIEGQMTQSFLHFQGNKWSITRFELSGAGKCSMILKRA